jgi:hypothetical protein
VLGCMYLPDSAKHSGDDLLRVEERCVKETSDMDS